ncbi:hypothetical protein FUA48_06520 [Flavobacterium alkalisoli]|uniref:Uncharacterized protein n=1 Tax=Flavobacterium alkalisoli TaxID=2602769 RepID=A0A5B9FWZ2_9FLAO|nr:hypothetical protein [Flavobacterium alkalisoli]QEE49242.1 hypothetical protein FUA48_06520 [Flavobacterium alkalisoli]
MINKIKYTVELILFGIIIFVVALLLVNKWYYPSDKSYKAIALGVSLNELKSSFGKEDKILILNKEENKVILVYKADIFGYGNYAFTFKNNKLTGKHYDD